MTLQAGTQALVLFVFGYCNTHVHIHMHIKYMYKIVIVIKIVINEEIHKASSYLQTYEQTLDLSS